jgi:hypothetical protein
MALNMYTREAVADVLTRVRCQWQDPSVRDAALSALLELYADAENHSPLHGFTARFQHRFAELVYDADEGVAVKGVRLVTMLVQAEEMPHDEACPHLLHSYQGLVSALVGTTVTTQPSPYRQWVGCLRPLAVSRSSERAYLMQVREVYRLLVDCSAPIRHAAAELVGGMLEDQGRRFLALVRSILAFAVFLICTGNGHSAYHPSPCLSPEPPKRCAFRLCRAR